MENGNQTEDLKQSLVQYQDQLIQIELALSSTKSGPEHDSLLGLKNDIEELIRLTKENLTSLQEQNTKSQSPVDNNDDDDVQDPFEKEYALFKAEIQKDVSQLDKDEDITNNQECLTADIKNELAALQGSKCQAPFSHKWDEGSNCAYHNALVMCVEDIDTPANNIQDIMVRVMFVNPVHKKMVPCPYYLEGDCKFPDDKCHYSHGELIPFADLREFKEPDFSSIKVGSRVLAKHKDNLWHHANVLDLISDDIIKVKFITTAGGTIDIDLHEVLPLDSNSSKSTDEVDKSDDVKQNSVLGGNKIIDGSYDSDASDSNVIDIDRDAIIQLSLLRTPTSSAVGDWEKHTKGIGSRLMANMGYIVGSGLGPRGDGRLEPVEALIFPPGKSLDHCMALRESAGGDPDMFKAEKRRLKEQIKEDKRREKEYEKEKQKVDVFSFINCQLSGSKSESEERNEVKTSKALASSSRRGLNVEKFRVSEDIRRVEKDLIKLKESLKRHQSGSAVHNHLSNKLLITENELNKLQASEQSITREQNRRDNTKKLAVF